MGDATKQTIAPLKVWSKTEKVFVLVCLLLLSIVLLEVVQIETANCCCWDSPETSKNITIWFLLTRNVKDFVQMTRTWETMGYTNLHSLTMQLKQNVDQPIEQRSNIRFGQTKAPKMLLEVLKLKLQMFLAEACQGSFLKFLFKYQAFHANRKVIR